MEDMIYNEVLNEISKNNMEDLMRYFNDLHRLTGTNDCDKAAQYICEHLHTYGIKYEKHEFQGYFSNPIQSELTIYIGNKSIIIPSRPRSFSLNCPQGIKGELVYDSKSKDVHLSMLEEQELYSGFKGKIVLSWNFYEDYVKKLESYGVVGIIHIWKSCEKVIHEETVGPVWGTPTLESSGWIPKIPVLGLQNEDGQKLVDVLSTKNIDVQIRSWIENRVDWVSLPVAYISGKSKKYILISGHYDSWYEGITDNAVGNAACLEIARSFNMISSRLERGIKIAFWPGHSNGRYLGSTWYCDNFWKDLHDNCIAHINIDSPGSKGAAVALPRTTKLEGVEFTSELIKEFFGEYPESFAEIPRGADQSFWGVDVPFHIMYKYEPAKDNKVYNCPGSGGGWWWHSEYDSLDKMDMDILIRDTRLNFATAYRLAMAKRLPVKFEAYFLKQKEMIESIMKSTDSSFDFQPILKALSSLSDKVLYTIKEVSNDEKANKIIKEIGGGVNRIVYSSGSEYDFDNAFPSKPFPGLQHLANVYRSNTPKEQFLFAMTTFVRQCNRIVNEMYKLERKLDIYKKP